MRCTKEKNGLNSVQQRLIFSVLVSANQSLTVALNLHKLVISSDR